MCDNLHNCSCRDSGTFALRASRYESGVALWLHAEWARHDSIFGLPLGQGVAAVVHGPPWVARLSLMPTPESIAITRQILLYRVPDSPLVSSHRSKDRAILVAKLSGSSPTINAGTTFVWIKGYKAPGWSHTRPKTVVSGSFEGSGIKLREPLWPRMILHAQALLITPQE